MTLQARGTHPPDERLAAFALGQLAETEAAAVASHVGDCDPCQAAVLAVPDDNVVALVRTFVAGGTVSVFEDAAPAELIGHERSHLLQRLGAGGMGVVYKAEHRLMGRTVALKVINRRLTAEPTAVERFRREVHAAARLSHPNIVTAYDAETAGDTHFLVMEYIEGTSLARLVKEGGPLPVAEACDYVRQAALGLQHAHERGMVHRDVKPDNLIRCVDGTVKVLDFGLAALTAERGGGLTEANVVMGTPDYMAPEQAEDAHSADSRADVYSLGCTLYKLLTGKVPYPAPTSLLRILAHREQALPAVREVRSGVPPELAAVLTCLLAKRPADRYQTAGEVAAALEPFTRPAVVKPPRKHRPLLVAIAVAALFAGMVLAVGVVYRIQTDKGELVITTQSNDVEVVIKQGGKQVDIIDTKTKKQITLALRSGTYELELKGAPKGLKLTIDKVTLTRGETVLAKIERIAKRAPAEKVRYLGHVPWPNRDVRIPLFSDDGKYVLGMANGNPCSLRLWEVATKKEVLTLDGLSGWMLAVFLPDSKHVLAKHADGTFRLWDVETRQSRKLPQVDAIAQRLHFPTPYATSPDGKLLCLQTQDPAKPINPGSFVVVELTTGKEVLRTPQLGPDWGLCHSLFSADGTRFYTVDTQPNKTTFRVWDLKGGKLAHSVTAPFAVAGRLALRDGERQIASESWVEQKVAFEFFDIETGKSAHRTLMPVRQDEWDGGLTSPGGRWYAVAHAMSATVRVFDLETGKQVLAHEGILVGGGGLGFSRDGRFFACAGPGGVHLFRLPDPPAARDKP